MEKERLPREVWTKSVEGIRFFMKHEDATDLEY